MNKLILIAILFSLSLPVSSARAQEILDEGDFVAGSDVIFDDDTKKSETDEDKEHISRSTQAEVTILEDKYAGEYVEANLENISKLYWKKDVLKTDNNKAIDNFLLINECDIYEKFYKDDFEWQRVRSAAKDMLEENKDSFSHKFKMVVPIDLGRYDMLRKGFPLINKTAFKDLRRVEIGGNSNNKSVCGNSRALEFYPKNLILILNKPFSYEFVDLDEHVAQAFIIRQKYNKMDIPKELQNKSFDRLAFARIRITFSDYQGTTRGRDNFPLAIMFGKLDGIDIFEDANEKRLLTSIDYKSNYRAKKKEEIKEPIEESKKPTEETVKTSDE